MTTVKRAIIATAVISTTALATAGLALPASASNGPPILTCATTYSHYGQLTYSPRGTYMAPMTSEQVLCTPSFTGTVYITVSGGRYRYAAVSWATGGITRRTPYTENVLVTNGPWYPAVDSTLNGTVPFRYLPRIVVSERS